MRSFVLTFVAFVGLVGVANAAEPAISAAEAAKFIGQQKTICGKVVSAHYSEKGKKQPTFLNLDKAYPDQILTIVVWGSDRGKFKQPPETAFSNKDICVNGKIGTFKNVPEVVISDPAQIQAK